MTSDLFGAPVLPPSLHGHSTTWLAKALAEAMSERKKALKKIKTDAAEYLALLTATAILVNLRTAAYQRACAGRTDPAADLLGWVNRQPAETLDAYRAFDHHQVSLTNVPIPRGGLNAAAIPLRAPPVIATTDARPHD